MHKPINERCLGCKYVIEYNNIKVCKAYIRPDYWWIDTGGRTCPLGVRSQKLNDKKPMKKKEDTPIMPKSPRSAEKWPSSGIRTPKRLKYRKGRNE